LKYFLSISLFLSLVIKPSAQQTFSLDTLLVQTTRIPLKASETGRSISILTKEQIQQLPATTFYELLQTISGVEVQSRGGFGVQGDIVMRGSTFSQVLVLIDGMKINDPLTGHFNCYVPVSNMEIERIEILKGAGASMYGPDAVGGVINIITKGFDSLKNGTTSSGSISYGDNNLVSSTASVFHKSNKFYVGLGASINHSKGDSILPVAVNDSTTLEGYRNYFDIKNISLSAGFKINNLWELKVRSSILSSDFNARYFYTSYLSDKSTEITSNWFNRVQFQRKTSTGSLLDINASYKRSSDEFLYTPTSDPNIHTMDYLNFTINNSNEINDKLIFKSGIQADLRKIESNDRGNHSDYHFGGYLMGVYKSNNLVLTTIAREDYDENYGFEFCPQINAAYNLPNLALRASAGRSIRAADYTERYNNNIALKTYIRLGNPNLMAERGWSEEIGINYSLSKNALFKATIFSRQSSNIIDYILTNESDIDSDIGVLVPGANYTFAKNIKDVNVNGFELELNSKFLISENSTLNWQMGYTFTDITNDTLGIYLSSFAKHLVNAQLILNYNSFQFSISGLYKERTAQAAESISSNLESSYGLLNARVGYGLLDNKLSLNLQILNLLDKEYQNILGAKMPGRWLMGGISWRLE
jgi:iron complex outermembrane receptor protein